MSEIHTIIAGGLPLAAPAHEWSLVVTAVRRQTVAVVGVGVGALSSPGDINRRGVAPIGVCHLRFNTERKPRLKFLQESLLNFALFYDGSALHIYEWMFMYLQLSSSSKLSINLSQTLVLLPHYKGSNKKN